MGSGWRSRARFLAIRAETQQGSLARDLQRLPTPSRFQLAQATPCSLRPCSCSQLLRFPCRSRFFTVAFFRRRLRGARIRRRRPILVARARRRVFRLCRDHRRLGRLPLGLLGRRARVCLGPPALAPRGLRLLRLRRAGNRRLVVGRFLRRIGWTGRTGGTSSAIRTCSSGKGCVLGPQPFQGAKGGLHVLDLHLESSRPLVEHDGFSGFQRPAEILPEVEQASVTIAIHGGPGESGESASWSLVAF
ncbi:MAG: hypothetical protein ACI80K_004031 [Paracoccaceae bacterium]|jgi:hypothetical protein